MPQSRIDRGITCDRLVGRTREWLVPNGRGGYASGTLAEPTRRYHALLMAAPEDPNERVATLVRLEEDITSANSSWRLDTHEFLDGTIAPEGYRFLQDFRLDFGLPIWVYGIDGWIIEKRLWMPYGNDAVCIQYRLVSGPGQVTLRLTPLIGNRPADNLLRRGDRQFAVSRNDGTLEVRGATECLAIRLTDGDDIVDSDWHYQFALREERSRGYDWVEDLFRPGYLTRRLDVGESATFSCAVEQEASTPVKVDGSLELEVQRRRSLAGQVSREEASLRRWLTLAADQFIVRDPRGEVTILAGYPWFGEWGRDAMLSLPGLFLTTGREREAMLVLQRWMGRIKEGLLPNTLRDESVAFNTADGSLLFLDTAYRTLEQVRDSRFRMRVYAAAQSIISSYVKGTQWGIQMDASDGLIRAEAPRMQLTWMDAKVGDWVVTPRYGKPVEINALWINALHVARAWSIQVDRPFAFQEILDLAQRSFTELFWYEAGGYLYDVVGGPEGSDPTLRPNQLLAISLPFPALTGPRAKRVVDLVTQELLTPVGLRTLPRWSHAYHGVYQGDQATRDAAYHQGTVWPWLLGPYVEAAIRAGYSKKALLRQLRLFQAHLTEAGIGTVSEIFDGDAPHAPKGCYAQAWSVAQLLWALHILSS
ncbi:MAG: amylo-alpha-1,6-glucosidase [Chloroflexi bacterium]|nr:amylo-alpha-1,6-glucosidase [Chloroflexota bacterium]